MIITKQLTAATIKISDHFTLREFRSPDSDIVKYDTDILAMLEKIRAHFGGPITITSGYRTPAYNKRVGGSTNSAHMDGRAADFKVKDKDGNAVSSKDVCMFLDEIGWSKKGGIGYINTATHFDTKFIGSRIDETRVGTTTRYYVVKPNYATYFGYKTRTVIIPKLNVRSGPATTYAAVGTRILGNRVIAYATKYDSKGRAWIKISCIKNEWVARWLTK